MCERELYTAMFVEMILPSSSPTSASNAVAAAQRLDWRQRVDLLLSLPSRVANALAGAAPDALLPQAHDVAVARCSLAAIDRARGTDRERDAYALGGA